MNPLEDLDPMLLARQDDPTDALVRLARQPARQLGDDRWLVSSPADVETVLGSPDAIVEPPRCAPELQGLITRMARFSDGDEHTGPRTDVDARLASLDLDALAADVEDRTRHALAAADRTVDVVGILRRVPAEALAAQLGADDPTGTVRAVTELVDAVAPHDEPRPRVDATRSAGQLRGLDPTTLAILFQTVDATSALAVAELTESRSPALVLTTRRAVRPIPVGHTTIPADAQVVVLLGAGAAAGHVDLQFGRGRHGCPGADIGITVADRLAEVLRGRTSSTDHPVDWQPRPNLRLPARLLRRPRRPER